MSAAAAIHPGFPDVQRVREDYQIKHNEQGYLHREEVQLGCSARRCSAPSQRCGPAAGAWLVQGGGASGA
jgi:hypothetical protein